MRSLNSSVTDGGSSLTDRGPRPDLSVRSSGLSSDRKFLELLLRGLQEAIWVGVFDKEWTAFYELCRNSK